MSGEVEASLWIGRIHCDLCGRLYVACVAENPDTATEVLCLLIEAKGLLDLLLGFEELGPPAIQGGLALSLDELLETFRLIHGR